MPIHWGAFTLAMHPWNDSPKRISKASENKKQSFFIPQIGEIFSIEDPIVKIVFGGNKKYKNNGVENFNKFPKD